MKSKKKLIINIMSNLLICITIALLALGASNSVISVVGDDSKPYYNGYSKDVSLMINVYWGAEFIEPMLDILDNYNSKATFFVGGSWIEKNTELLEMISDRGHEIGNHGYLHRDHKKLSINANREEIIITNKLIEEITGKTTTLFAPPSGSYGDNVMNVCQELNMRVIMWSKDTIDWRDKDSSLILKRATKNIQAGDFILMHPTAHTLNALSAILECYKKDGLKSITVSENLTGITL